MDFASYEKSTTIVISKIKHTIRLRLNERAIDIQHILKNVPSGAILVMIVDDDDENGVCELIFDEEVTDG